MDSTLQELRHALTAMSLDAERLGLIHDEDNDCWLLVDHHDGYENPDTHTGHTLAAFFEGDSEPPALAAWILEQIRKCGKAEKTAA